MGWLVHWLKIKSALSLKKIITNDCFSSVTLEVKIMFQLILLLY